MISRRKLLQRGVLGGALLAIGGGTLSFSTRERPGGTRLSHEEAVILSSAAEAFVPARSGFPTLERIGFIERVETILARVDPRDVEDFKSLLRLIENRWAGLFLDARAKPFTQLSAAGRMEALTNWAHSRLVLRRTGYDALRSVVLGAYYSASSTWAALGYPGPPPEFRKQSAE